MSRWKSNWREPVSTHPWVQLREEPGPYSSAGAHPAKRHLPQSPPSEGGGPGCSGDRHTRSTGLLVISKRFKRSDEKPVTGGRVAIKSCHV